MSQAAVPWLPAKTSEPSFTTPDSTREEASTSDQGIGIDAAHDKEADVSPDANISQRRQHTEVPDTAASEPAAIKVDTNVLVPDIIEQTEPLQQTRQQRSAERSQEPCLAPPEAQRQEQPKRSYLAAQEDHKQSVPHAETLCPQIFQGDSCPAHCSPPVSLKQQPGQSPEEQDTAKGSPHLAATVSVKLAAQLGAEENHLTMSAPSTAGTPQCLRTSTTSQKDGQASVMDVLLDAQKLATTPNIESTVRALATAEARVVGAMEEQPCSELAFHAATCQIPPL